VGIPEPWPGATPVRVGILGYQPEPGVALPPSPAECPVCGLPTAAEDRERALLNPEYANGFRFLHAVWVHRECLASCPLVEGPDSVPW
jgi:hypothetical protein